MKNIKVGGVKMTAKELAKESKVPLWKVYYVARKLGKLPSVDELLNWKQKRGRPIKWKTKNEKEN
jgi:hypothetical protein